MLAKNANDNAGVLNERSVCEFFASKLAPTPDLGLEPSHFLFGLVPEIEQAPTQVQGPVMTTSVWSVA